MLDFFEGVLQRPIDLIALVIAVTGVVAGVLFLVISPKLFLLTLKNLRRNKLRTILTSLATMALVFMVTLILAVVFFIDQQTTEKARDIKLLVTERWQAQSQLPLTHADYLDPASPKNILNNLTRKDEQGRTVPVVGPNDFMTWSFYGGAIDEKKTRESIVFFFCMNPDHIPTMMEDLENINPALIKKLKETPNGCLVGPERLEMLKQRVGGRIKVTSFNYKGIDLEFEIVGVLPQGRWVQSAIMNADYFNRKIDEYPRTAQGKGQKHPLDMKRLNLIWLRVPDRDSFNRVAAVIDKASGYGDSQSTNPDLQDVRVVFDPPVKVETFASGIGSFLDAYRDILWGVKWLLVPAILASMALVVSNAISISVRERRTEMAVMKVLGYRPGQILSSVLGESLLVGGVSGLLAAGLTAFLINGAVGGIKFPIGFFPAFLIPLQAIYWGMAMGFATAFFGSFLPAWKARGVKVSEVFAKVA
jgi:putative ABC transport system permease protein